MPASTLSEESRSVIRNQTLTPPYTLKLCASISCRSQVPQSIQNEVKLSGAWREYMSTIRKVAWELVDSDIDITQEEDIVGREPSGPSQEVKRRAKF